MEERFEITLKGECSKAFAAFPHNLLILITILSYAKLSLSDLIS